VNERQLPGERAAFHLHFESNAFTVGEVIDTILRGIQGVAPDSEVAGTVEIVMAEVINNIIEHAYNDRAGQPIEVAVTETAGTVDFHFRDRGRPMPLGVHPSGAQPDLDVPCDQLPEGGFGWMLIHRLTSDLRYWRDGTMNHLSFSISTNESTGAQGHRH